VPAANASKPAETIGAGELGRGVTPVAIRREQPIQPAEAVLEGWLDTQLDESVSTAELS
jgi:hypothetical protein